jgi:hypothetical protein
MSVVEVALTPKQLASAYTQLRDDERRSFLEAVFEYPTNQQAVLELIVEARAALKRKFSPAKQRLLDKLLDKNATGALGAKERKQLEQLTEEYGEGLIDKARARYILELARKSAFTNVEPS